MTFRFAVGLAILFSMTSTFVSAADQGASLYKTKCSGCHGANGEGKPTIKAPALKGTAMDASQIAQHILKGEPESKAPHNKGISGLNEDQAKAIAEYIKALK